MPDDRLFHVRLLQSEKVYILSDFERGVWFTCRLACDDFGVIKFSGVTLQEAARFLESRSAKAVQQAFERVRDVGLVGTFDYEDRKYCFQRDWADWQKVDYPRATLLPKPPAGVIETCSAATQHLFAAHPGGWRGKKKPSAIPSEGFGNVSPKPSATPTPKPLAVSREPLAESRKPVAGVPAAPADARSKHPIFRCARFVVFDWLLEDIRQLLGPHFEGFFLDEWFYALSARADAEGLLIDKTAAAKWVYAATIEEAERRGLRTQSSSLRPEDLVMLPGDLR